MGRLIDSDDVIKNLCPFYSHCEANNRCETVTYCSFYDKLKKIPNAEKGKWTHVCAEGACYYECSKCLGKAIVEMEECPHCHSKMKVGEK